MNDIDRGRHKAFLFRLELQVALAELHSLQHDHFVIQRIDYPRMGRHGIRQDNLRWRGVQPPRGWARRRLGILSEESLRHVALGKRDYFTRQDVNDALNYLTHGVLLSAPQVRWAVA